MRRLAYARRGGIHAELDLGIAGNDRSRPHV
jgi:hypothetical protein